MPPGAANLELACPLPAIAIARASDRPVPANPLFVPPWQAVCPLPISPRRSTFHAATFNPLRAWPSLLVQFSQLEPDQIAPSRACSASGSCHGPPPAGMTVSQLTYEIPYKFRWKHRLPHCVDRSLVQLFVTAGAHAQ